MIKWVFNGNGEMIKTGILGGVVIIVIELL